MSLGPKFLKTTLFIVDKISIYDKNTMTPPKQLQPPLELFHPVVNPVLVVKLVTNINTIRIFVLITVSVQSKKIHIMHITINRMKHRTNVFSPINGNTTYGNKCNGICVINIKSNNILHINNAFQHRCLDGTSLIYRK